MKYTYRKRILAMLLVLGLMLSMAACAVGTSKPADGSKSTEGSKQEEEQKPAGRTVYALTKREYKNYAAEGYTQAYTFQYDEDGRLVNAVEKGDYEVDFVVVYENGVATAISYEQTPWFQFTWDQKGNLLEYILTYGQGEDADVTICQREYDSDGRMITSQFVDENGDAETRTVYTYENGLLVREEIYMGKISEPGWIRIYTYDEKGNLIRQEEDGNYNERNGDITEYSYTYDAQDNILTEEAVCEDERTVTTFDAQGNVLSLKVYKGEELTREYAYTYQVITADEKTENINETIVSLLD